jgi:hypothetical protein
MGSGQALIWMAGLAITALAAFAVYRWRQRQRVRRVETWVKDYVSVHYGGPPDHLNINCSDDPLWPVFVGFNNPRTGVRHNLQFACPGPPATFSLLSEKEHPREKGRLLPSAEDPPPPVDLVDRRLPV